jgi:hypothetical protein
MKQETVIVSNGNLLSMVALGPWLLRHLNLLRAVYITHLLPSQKSNLLGLVKVLSTSGFAYTNFKLATNVLLPLTLQLRGLPSSLEGLLRRAGWALPIRHVLTANAPDVVDEIRRLAPDYLLSFSATHRFQEPLINAAKVAAINVHYSLLPEYAGLSPYFWYLCHGRKVAGVTFHQIAFQLDAGSIIEQVRFPTADLDSVLALALKDAETAGPILERFYAGETSLEHLRPQDLSQRTYCGHPTRADVRALWQRNIVFSNRAARHTLLDRVVDLAAQADRIRSGRAAPPGSRVI